MKKLLFILSALAVFACIPFLVKGSDLAMNCYLTGGGYVGQTTAVGDSADTIKVTIPPMSGARIVITGGVTHCDTTAHKAYFLVPNVITTLKKAMLASAVACTLTDTIPDAGGNAPAAGDIIVIEHLSGIYQTVTCSVYSAGGSVEFKHGEAIATTAAAGKKAWAFGAPGDANNLMYQLTALTENTFPAQSIVGKMSCPLVYRQDSFGATGCDTLRYLTWSYIDK